MEKYYFTSESVTEGHPDKICDQISDAVLDACLAADPHARVACETATKTGLVLLFGEIRSSHVPDFQAIARRTIKEIGYDSSEKGFDYKTCNVLCAVEEQSPDIAQGVDASDDKELGAGDQGMMFGYATDETPHGMPLTIDLAHALAKQLSVVRKNNALPYLRPDGKTQVTIEYADGVAKRIEAIVVSTQHAPDVSQEELRTGILREVITPVIPANLLDEQTIYHINPTGNFVIGGPQGDAGLTGRKIIIDTYGGHGAHGGGAFSGKDPSKVDRSAAYMARHVAKNIVAAGLAKQCQVQLSYAIGISEPLSVHLETYGTQTVPTSSILAAVHTTFPLSASGIIKYLDLRRPIYQKTAAYGHFGRDDPDFTWEQTTKVEELQACVQENAVKVECTLEPLRNSISEL